MSHLHTFSDASLATLLLRAQLRIVAAWYFGMDAYELIVNLAMQQSDESLIYSRKDLITSLQSCIDAARACDGVAVIARPISDADMERFGGLAS
jgi:hypothetical protein